MNSFLFLVLKVVIITVILIVMKYAVPYMRTVLEHSKFKFVAEAAAYAVKYAEQTVLGDKTGPEKKAIVTKFLEEMLTAKHISISAAQIDALIEAAVYAMNLAKKV